MTTTEETLDEWKKQEGFDKFSVISYNIADSNLLRLIELSKQQALKEVGEAFNKVPKDSQTRAVLNVINQQLKEIELK